MDEQGLPGRGELIEHRFLSGGTQNEIYEISRGELRCAMRIPPPSPPAGRDEGIRREWRIIEALTGTDVPHAEAVAVCADPSVLGRAFYLMGFVDGWSPMSQPGWPAPFDADLAARQALAHQMAEGIARLSGGGLAGKGPARPGAARWLPRTPGRPVDRLPRADQGPRTSRLRRGGRLAPGSSPARLHPGPHARRLSARQRDVPARRPGPAGRDRRLGDGHRW